MAINRYRLRHKARAKKSSAALILKLLKRPDRLLGMILIGNSLANILASALVTLIAVHFWGETGVFIATLILTFFILVFAEVAPKTVAALYPEKMARWVAWPVHILLKIFYPFVWLINTISNGVLRVFGFQVKARGTEPLNREELRSVVHETTGKISSQYQNMLLNILDLNQIEITEVMIPQHKIIGIDLDDPWEKIQQQIASSEVNWLPVYQGNINDIRGILYLRDFANLVIERCELTKEVLLKQLHEPYFVPEGTPLNIQLMNFQQKRMRFALVVDEYGEIQGLITLEDILEEIVGEFTTNVATLSKIALQTDGSYLVEGSVTIRDFNRATHWKLPTHGSRTLNGLIVEHLETIPQSGVGLRIAEYRIEVLRAKDNVVELARVFPPTSE